LIMGRMNEPIHPGEILLEEFLGPLTSASTGWHRRSAFRRAGSTR
jgi:plasmid maintenance system antidote protein VapI